jgi:SAM-dependent methyltransferase
MAEPVVLKRIARGLPLMRRVWRATLGPAYPDVNRLVVQRPLVLRLLGNHLGRTLEVGCGEGMYTQSLAARSTSLFVSDLSVAPAQSLMSTVVPRPRGIACDAQKLPFAPGVFDTVVMTEVLEHLPEDRRTLERIHALLKDGGRFLLSVPTPPVPIHDSLHVREGYSIEDLTSLLDGAGFTVVEHQYCLHWLSYWLVPRLQQGHYVPAGVFTSSALLDRTLRLGRPWDLVVLARKR